VAGGAPGRTPSVGDAFAGVGRRPIIGLSIEGTDLRLISVSGRKIERVVCKPLPADLMPGGVVADPAAFGAAVSAILTEYEVPRGTVVAGFPDTDAIARMMTLPKEAGKKLVEVAQREARRDPVIGQGDYRIYQQKVGESESEITAFVLAVRRIALEQYLAGLRQAAILPHMVELRPLAMIRAINQPHTIIANVERTSLDVVVVNNNLPLIMRSVPLSGSDAEMVEVVTLELGRTIESYNSNQPQPLNPRLPMVLIGELSAQPDMVEAVEQRLGHPIAPLTCPFAAPPGFAVANFVVNIGLVLKAQ
jgi:hypothetical protein